MDNIWEQKEVQCPLCGSDDSGVIYDRRVYAQLDTAIPIRDATGRKFHEITRLCRNCGMVFVSPRMTEESLLLYYGGCDEKGYQSHRELSAVEVRKKIPAARWRRDILRQEYCRPGMTHLDIGADVGALVSLNRESGVLSEGLEPNPGGVNAARTFLGVDLVPERLQDFKGEKSYDLITINRVLEHTVEPVPFLCDAVARLEYGGHIYVEVPDLARPWRHSWIFFHPHHTLGFVETTLEALFQKCGLQVVKSGHLINNFLYMVGKKMNSGGSGDGNSPQAYHETKDAVLSFLVNDMNVLMCNGHESCVELLEETREQFPWPQNADILLVDRLVRSGKKEKAFEAALRSLEVTPTVYMWKTTSNLGEETGKLDRLTMGTAGYFSEVMEFSRSIAIPRPGHTRTTISAHGAGSISSGTPVLKDQRELNRIRRRDGIEMRG